MEWARFIQRPSICALVAMNVRLLDFRLLQRITLGLPQCGLRAALAMRASCTSLCRLLPLHTICTRWWIWHSESRPLGAQTPRLLQGDDMLSGLDWAERAGLLVACDRVFIPQYDILTNTVVEPCVTAWLTGSIFCDEPQKVDPRQVEPTLVMTYPPMEGDRLPFWGKAAARMCYDHVLASRVDWINGTVRALGIHVNISKQPDPPQSFMARAIYGKFYRAGSDKPRLNCNETLNLIMSGVWHGDWDIVKWCMDSFTLSWETNEARDRTFYIPHMVVLAQTCPRWDIFTEFTRSYVASTRQAVHSGDPDLISDLVKGLQNQGAAFIAIGASRHMLEGWIASIGGFKGLGVGEHIQWSHIFESVCRYGDLSTAEWFHDKCMQHFDAPPNPRHCIPDMGEPNLTSVIDPAVAEWLEEFPGHHPRDWVVAGSKRIVTSFNIRSGMYLEWPREYPE